MCIPGAHIVSCSSPCQQLSDWAQASTLCLSPEHPSPTPTVCGLDSLHGLGPYLSLPRFCFTSKGPPGLAVLPWPHFQLPPAVWREQPSSADQF